MFPNSPAREAVILGISSVFKVSAILCGVDVCPNRVLFWQSFFYKAGTDTYEHRRDIARRDYA